MRRIAIRTRVFLDAISVRVESVACGPFVGEFGHGTVPGLGFYCAAGLALFAVPETEEDEGGEEEETADAGADGYAYCFAGGGAR